MILEINKKQSGINKDMANEVKRLLRFSLSRFEGVITRVKVRLVDVNGPKGGVDKRCRISAKFRTSGQLIVLGEGSNYIEALSSCLERLVRSARRKLEKRRYLPFRIKRRGELVDDVQNEEITV